MTREHIDSLNRAALIAEERGQRVRATLLRNAAWLLEHPEGFREHLAGADTLQHLLSRTTCPKEGQ